MEKYYVYAHSNEKYGVFYVGKGSGKRLFNTASRSVFWKNITKKHGFVASIIEAVDSEDKAFDREIFWIAHYKELGECIANLTLGGDGVRVSKRWWNDKISESLKGVKRKSGESSPSYKDLIGEEELVQLYLEEKLSSVEIANLVGLSIPTICTRLKKYGIAVREPGIGKRGVICTTTGKEFDSISDAAKEYGLFRTNVNKVLSGRHKTAGGKHFKYKDE